MATKRIHLGDGKWFSPDAAKVWGDANDFDGRNNISRATGSQWEHEALYRTKKGLWVLNHWSAWQGSRESYEIITETEAYAWLVANDHADAVPATYLESKEV